MEPIRIQVMRHHNTPVFVTKADHTDLARVYGYLHVKRLGHVFFPAFLPFADHVISDLGLVFGDENIVWEEEAVAHLSWLAEERRRRELNQLPADFNFVTKPFDHQKEGVIRALYEPRTGLFFDCGLGKTKTTIDLLRAIACVEPGTPTLILCPAHLAPTWEHEFNLHGDGTLRVLTLLDANSKTVNPTKRKHAYAGTRELEPVWTTDHPWAEDFPDIVYEPSHDPAFAVDIGDLELEYLRAVQDENAAAKTRTRAQLRRAAKKHGVDLPPPAKKVDPAPEPAANYDVVVLPYSVLTSDLDQILEHVPFGILVCDESHMLRSPSSKRSRAVTALASRAHRRYMLSGTPALGTPMHLFTQLTLLGFFLTGSWWQFYRRYNVIKRVTNWGKEHDEVMAFKNLNVLNEIVTEVALRKKAEDCLDLPPVRVIPYHVPVGAETRDTYNELILKFGAEIAGGEVHVAHAADRLTKLLQILSGFYIDSQKNYELCDDCPNLLSCARLGIKPYTPKCVVEPEAPPTITVRLKDTDRLDYCIDLFHSILASPENKVIVWATFRVELDMLSEAFQEEGWRFVQVDGRTKDKEAAKDEFNNDPECRIYLSQISTGVGITLNAANYTVFYNATFDLGHYIQAQKRNDRIGQLRPVTVYHVTTPGSVNEYIYRSLAQKVDISAALTDNIKCMMCARNADCNAAGIAPFDEGCIYSKKMRRPYEQPALLE